MKIVIDIAAEDFEKVKCGRGAVSMMRKAIIHCTPLPEGAEILTKEAYSDLCARAADVPGTNVGELISRQAAKSKAIYSPERHEKVVPVAELDWLPSVEPEKCSDCINREALLRKLQKVSTESWKMELKCNAETVWNQCIDYVKDAPTVEPERKTGKWLPAPKGNTIIISDEMADISLRLPTALCSNCGEVVPVIGRWKRYCSMCGNRMEVDE